MDCRCCKTGFRVRPYSTIIRIAHSIPLFSIDESQTARAQRFRQQGSANSARVAAQGPGLRGLWFLGVGRFVRTWRLHKPPTARRALRRCPAAVRQNPACQRGQHGRLRLLLGGAADRSGRTASGPDGSKTSIAAEHREDSVDRSVSRDRTKTSLTRKAHTEPDILYSKP